MLLPERVTLRIILLWMSETYTQSSRGLKANWYTAVNWACDPTPSVDPSIDPARVLTDTMNNKIIIKISEMLRTTEKGTWSPGDGYFVNYSKMQK